MASWTQTHTLTFSLFMVVAAVVFTFFVHIASFVFRVIAKSAMTKCTHTFFASFSTSTWFYCMWNSIFQSSNKKNNESLYFIIHRLIQRSNCFRFSLFHYRWAFVRAIITNPSIRTCTQVPLHSVTNFAGIHSKSVLWWNKLHTRGSLLFLQVKWKQ